MVGQNFCKLDYFELLILSGNRFTFRMGSLSIDYILTLLLAVVLTFKYIFLDQDGDHVNFVWPNPPSTAPDEKCGMNQSNSDLDDRQAVDSPDPVEVNEGIAEENGMKYFSSSFKTISLRNCVYNYFCM